MISTKNSLLLVVALLVVAPVALADPPIQEFNVALKTKSVKEGRFSVTVTSRSTDPNGQKADPVSKVIFRFPAGMKFRKEFLNRKYTCEVAKLKETKNPETCKHAKIGFGKAKVDARPLVPEEIPADIHIFLGKGPAGAVGSMIILGMPISDDSFIRNSKQVLQAPIYNRPTPDGRFGYQMELDATIETGIPNLEISIPEVSTTVNGLTLKKKKHCKSGNSRCKKAQKLFWVTPPTCSSTHQLFFQADFAYKTSPQLIKDVALPCLNIDL